MTELFLLATTDDTGGQLDPIAVFHSRAAAEAHAQALEERDAEEDDRLPRHLTWTDPDNSPWREATAAAGWSGFYTTLALPVEPAVAKADQT